MEMLDDQGAQLDRIGALQDSSMASLDVAEKQLSIMESLTAWLWSGSSKAKRPAGQENGGVAASSGEGAAEGASARAASGSHFGDLEADTWEVVPKERAAAGSEDDAYLGEVRSGVAQLHHMALRIGDTLDTQNRQLRDMHNKGDVLSARMGAANSRINGLLK